MNKLYQVHNKGDGRYYINVWLNPVTLNLAYKGNRTAQRDICQKIRKAYGLERRIYWNVIKHGIKEKPTVKNTLSHCDKENCSYCENGYYEKCPNNK